MLLRLKQVLPELCRVGVDVHQNRRGRGIVCRDLGVAASIAEAGSFACQVVGTHRQPHFPPVAPGVKEVRRNRARHHRQQQRCEAVSDEESALGSAFSAGLLRERKGTAGRSIVGGEEVCLVRVDDAPDTSRAVAVFLQGKREALGRQRLVRAGLNCRSAVHVQARRCRGPCRNMAFITVDGHELLLRGRRPGAAAALRAHLVGDDATGVRVIGAPVVVPGTRTIRAAVAIAGIPSGLTT